MVMTQPIDREAAGQAYPGAVRSEGEKPGAQPRELEPDEFDEDLNSVFDFTCELPRDPDAAGADTVPSDPHLLELDHANAIGGFEDADSHGMAPLRTTGAHTTGEAGSPAPGGNADAPGPAGKGDAAMTARPYPRVPNLALRRVRQRMRLSQAQFAEAVRAAGNAMGVPNHCTKRLIQKWESGEHAACRPDYLRVLQAVTGLSARELGFRVFTDEPEEPTAESGDGAESTQGESSDDQDRAGTAAALVPLGLAEYYPDAAVEESMDRLRQALENPSKVDARVAELVEAATSRLFDLEHHSPSRLLAPTVERHMAMATSLLTAAQREGVRRRLTVSSGRTALLAGWLAFDRGDTLSAHRLWDAGLGAAEGTADNALFAASLVHQSYAAARRGDLETAWQLAHTAASRTPHDSRATAWAASRVALYAAQLGEREVAEAAIQRALKLGAHLPDPKPGDGTMPWTRSFGHAALLSSTAHTAALLKDPRAPDYAAQAVDGLSPAKVKARAVALAECALVAAMVGDIDLCLDYGSAAATLTRDLDVSIAADLLYEVVPIILPYCDTRAARELLPQLTRLTRTADRENELRPDLRARPAADGAPAPASSPGGSNAPATQAAPGIPQSKEDGCTS
jgi:transcriptional regulator with XRE-family HTH domain